MPKPVLCQCPKCHHVQPAVPRRDAAAVACPRCGTPVIVPAAAATGGGVLWAAVVWGAVLAAAAGVVAVFIMARVGRI